MRIRSITAGVTLPRYFDVLIQAGNAARFLGDSGTAAGCYEEAGRARRFLDPVLQSRLPPGRSMAIRMRPWRCSNDSARLGLVSLPLVDDNPDFDSVRVLPGWEALKA